MWQVKDLDGQGRCPDCRSPKGIAGMIKVGHDEWVTKEEHAKRKALASEAVRQVNATKLNYASCLFHAFEWLRGEALNGNRHAAILMARIQKLEGLLPHEKRNDGTHPTTDDGAKSSHDDSPDDTKL